jgi:hypothetical protein
MKFISTLLFAAVVLGCANMTAKQTSCCGLSKAQWHQYDERAANAVLSPAAWGRVGAKKPKAVQPASRTDLFGTTNSPDGIRPPTHVEIHVPIVRMGNTLRDPNVVVVEFSHPDGKITGIHADAVIYD